MCLCMKIGILVPAYNEESIIGETLDGILKYSKDIVVIDDGSTDKTHGILKEYPVKIIKNKKNIGLSETVKVGLRYFLKNDYDYVIKMDADGQMMPSKIKDFTDKIKKNPDVDVFYATIDKVSSWEIKKDIKYFSLLFYLGTGIKISDFLSEYRAYNKKSMKFLIRNKENEGYASCFTLIDMKRLGFKISEINGGVIYTKETARPFPLEGKIQFTKNFIKKTFKFKGIRSKIVASLMIFPLLVLIIFNLIFCSRFNSILPRRFLR